MKAPFATSRFVSPAAASSATRSSVAVSSSGARRLGATRASSLRACSIQRWGAQPLEDLERVAQRLGSRSPPLRAAEEPALNEPRAGELERQLRGRADVELVDRRQRRLGLALGRKHERPRPRQGDVDPEARKRPATLLQSLEGRPGAVEFAEGEQRLDVEGLAPVEERLRGAARIYSCFAFVQRSISRFVLVRGELDEAKIASRRRPTKCRRRLPRSPRSAARASHERARPCRDARRRASDSRKSTACALPTSSSSIIATARPMYCSARSHCPARSSTSAR